MPSPAPALVRARSLRKRYGRALALDGLDLEVREGEIHGFLGPNGAGKSTTIRILLGLVRATAGSVEVLGRDPWRDPVATNRDVAYVPGDVALWPNLTGGEAIDLLLSLRGGAEPGERARLLEAFELDPRKKARTYSKGNRQKVALVAAFARRARLYILDEPTSGLDPLMEAVFRDEVRRVRAAGSTVLLSSHLLSEVEQLCDRVTIIRAGRAVETSTLAELVSGAATRFEVTGVDAPRLAGSRASTASRRSAASCGSKRRPMRCPPCSRRSRRRGRRRSRRRRRRSSRSSCGTTRRTAHEPARAAARGAAP